MPDFTRSMLSVDSTEPRRTESQKLIHTSNALPNLAKEESERDSGCHARGSTFRVSLRASYQSTRHTKKRIYDLKSKMLLSFYMKICRV